jgi:hypothetical protein
MNFDFGEVLGRMWKIGWNHKVLWLFQMLPGLLSFFFIPFFVLVNPAFAMFLPEPWNRLAYEPWVFVVSMVLMSILILPIMFVSVLAQSATTLGALKVEQGAEKLSFRELIKESMPYFWRLVGLYTVFGTAWILFFFLFMALSAGLSIITFGFGMICMTPLFLLSIPAVVVSYAVMELAKAAIIADDLSVNVSISKGWQLFRTNVLSIVVLMLILYFGMTAISSVVSFPMMFPMMLLPMSFNPQADFNNYSFIPFIVILLAIIFVVFILMFVIQAILMAFFQSAWVVAYLRLDRGQNRPVLVEAVA